MNMDQPPARREFEVAIETLRSEMREHYATKADLQTTRGEVEGLSGRFSQFKWILGIGITAAAILATALAGVAIKLIDL